jgi:ubiquinone biosynthesis protein
MRLAQWTPGNLGKQTRRYRDIVRVFARHGIADVLGDHRTLTRAEHLRRALEELGPTFIKFGQALSVRADLLPPVVVDELSNLQDHVPALPLAEVEACITRELGAPARAVFAAIDPVPLGSASIAQVHAATLRTGEHVALKVRRPNLRATIDADLAVLAQLARLAARRSADARLYDPPGLVAEFERTITRELDLAREGRMIERFAENGAGDERFVFPRVYWAYTRPGLLTLEHVDGFRLADVIDRRSPGLDCGVIARRGADAVLKQVLVDGLFHADPHPGNILVKPGNVICLLDFGIVGHLDARGRDRIATLVRAIARRDAVITARALMAIAKPAGDVDRSALEADAGDLIESYVGSRLGDIALVEVWSQIVALIARHRLQLPSNLMLLIKALLTIEGVGRRLDDSFRMFEHAAPFVERLKRERLHPRRMAARAARSGEDIAATLSTVPEDVMDLLDRVRTGRLNLQISHPESHELADAMLVAAGKFGQALVGAATLIGVAILMSGNVSGDTWTTAVIVMVVCWVAIVLGLTRIRRMTTRFRRHHG